MSALEQERRDFMRANRRLYDYIAALESAKALDSAGGSASGATDQYGAANRVWEAAARAKARATEMLCA